MRTSYLDAPRGFDISELHRRQGRGATDIILEGREKEDASKGQINKMAVERARNGTPAEMDHARAPI